MERSNRVTQRAHETWRWRWDEQGTKLSQTVCTTIKEDSQRTTTLTDNKRETTKTKDLQCMMTHTLASDTLRSHSRVPQVFQVIPHFVGFRLVLRVVSWILVVVTIHSILICTRILCRVHTAKTGLWRCCLHIMWGRDASKKGFEGSHDCFQNDSTFRDSQLGIDRTDEVCIQMDKDAQKDLTYRMSQDEYFRFKKNRWISLKTSGRNEPMKLRFRLQRSVHKIASSSPSVWRRATRTDSLATPEMAPVVFFIQYILVAVERFVVELMTINKLSNWAHVKSSMIERGDPLCRFCTKLLSSLLQSTGGASSTHTSHFLIDLHAHAWLKS